MSTYSIAKTESLIASFENTLAQYEAELKINPNSLFCRGMVKNTKELIAELTLNLMADKKDIELDFEKEFSD